MLEDARKASAEKIRDLETTGENQLREIRQLQRRITSAFTAVTVTVPYPTNIQQSTVDVDDPNPEPEAPPTSLALPCRIAFLFIGMWTPLFAIGHATIGDDWYMAMCLLTMTTC